VKSFRPLLIVVILILVCATLYVSYPPFRLFTIAALGRSPDCPMSHALLSHENLKRQIALKDSILAHSKLIEKDPKGFHLWQTPHGRFWIPEGNDYVLPFNLAEQERAIYGSGDDVGPKSGDVVLDCGANVGDTVRFELDAGASKVIAIEPAPDNVECIRRNYPNEIASGRVVVVPKGVWDHEDTLTLRVVPKNSAADTFVMSPPGAEQSVKVPLTTVDHLVADLNLTRVDYIKMDIEGAEAKALLGSHDTLVKWKPRLSIATEHSPDDPKNITDAVMAARRDYKRECGPCLQAGTRIRPDVFYFH